MRILATKPAMNLALVSSADFAKNFANVTKFYANICSTGVIARRGTALPITAPALLMGESAIRTNVKIVAKIAKDAKICRCLVW